VKNWQWKNITTYLLLATMTISIATISGCVNYFEKPEPAKKTMMTYDRFIQAVKQGKIEKVGLSADRSKVAVQAKDGTKTIVNLPSDSKQLIEILAGNIVEVYVLPQNSSTEDFFKK
jgi:cell division protease FtsH